MYLLSCQPRTVFKKGNIEIDYLDKFRCLHLNWGGNITEEVYISIMTEMLKFSEKLKVEFWLLDARDGDNFQLFDRNWASQFFTQDLPKHSVKKIARIAGGDFHFETQISGLISEILRGKDIPFQFKYLPDADQALTWFLNEED